MVGGLLSVHLFYKINVAGELKSTINVFNNGVKAFIIFMQQDEIGLQVWVNAMWVWGKGLLQHTWFYQFTDALSLVFCLR